MKTRNLALSAACCIGLMAAGNASAHTFGAHGAGFGSGLAHPFMGLDHLLAMIAVGIWAMQLGGKAVWQVPLAFVSVMAGGALVANTGLDLSLVEGMIAASVLVLGLLVAGCVRLPTLACVAGVSVFALFHGYAHGLEMPQASVPLAYAAGFVVTTIGLHMFGVLLGGYAIRARLATRLGGAVIALSGMMMFVGA